MKKLQAFMVTFTVTFGIMLLMFGGLYRVVSNDVRAAETKQQGVPVLQLQPKDSKTVLWVHRGDAEDTFFIIKLNAIQSKVSVVAIGQNYYMENSQRTLKQAMEYAGVRQCVQDLSEHFDIKISWHLVCDGKTAAEMLDFMEDVPTELSGEEYDAGNGTQSPVGVAELVEMLDNHPTDTTAAAQAVSGLIKANMPLIYENMKAEIKKHYTDLNTDMNTEELSQLEKIAGMLCGDATEYGFVGAVDSTQSGQAVQTELNG